MKFGFVVPGGDVDTLIDFAQEIEAAGWDAVFVADGVYGTDAWISLAAIAVKTQRIRLGPLITPPSRCRPWTLASQAATLDRLSGGRMILSVGLGAIDTGFDRVGEAIDRKTRAELLDESLEIITGFWSGEPFHHHGRHYTVDWDVPWSYRPVQSPRIPIWVVAAWPRRRSLERALSYDGVLPNRIGSGGSLSAPTPEDIAEVDAFVAEHRRDDSLFDIVVEGITPADDREAAAKVTAYADAGATWWIESMWDVPGGLDAALHRVQQGPPEVR